MRAVKGFSLYGARFIPGYQSLPNRIACAVEKDGLRRSQKIAAHIDLDEVTVVFVLRELEDCQLLELSKQVSNEKVVVTRSPKLKRMAEDI